MAMAENEWYQERLVAELGGAARQTEPIRAVLQQQRRRRRFTEVCNFADASWLTWLESRREGEEVREGLCPL